MPKMSDTMEEGVIAAWLKKVGDKVASGDILAEVEKVCTHVAVLKKGQLLAEGSVEDILHDQQTWEVSSENPDSLAMVFSLNSQVTDISRDGDLVIIKSHEVTGQEINEFAYKNGIVLSHLQARKKSLESHFLALIADSDDKPA